MRRLACLLPLLLTGCSYVYEVSYTVTLTSPSGARPSPVVLVLSERHAGTGTQNDETLTLTPAPESTTVTGTMASCCAPEPTVSLWAFLDSNSNGSWDPGEAKAVDPRGVFVLKEDTTTRLSLLVPAAEPAGQAPAE